MSNRAQTGYISLCGMLGYGYNIQNFLKKVAGTELDFIGVDAGSTDPGPYYLGSGTGFVKDAQLIRDIEPALAAAFKYKLPIVIGSAGGAGARPHLETTASLVRELCRKNSFHFKAALIYSDMDSAAVLSALKEGRIRPCENVPELKPDVIKRCSNIVAQMGTEPIIDALRNGADLVIAGRSCDTAVFAAHPIMKGFDPGLALHAAKIAECGALCSVPAGANDSLHVVLRRNSFTVEPVSSERKCTPESVAAHSLYEQPHPSRFYEPEGEIDMSASRFKQSGKRSVKVSGTVLVEADAEELKLEGSRPAGHRSITIAGTCDPAVIRNIDSIQAAVRTSVAETVDGLMPDNSYSLRFLRYGLDAVTFGARRKRHLPQEVGLVMEAIASSQKDADLIVSLARSTALHQGFAGRKATAGNLAYPFSPSDFRGGPVYEFSIYHLMKMKAGESEKIFRTVYEEF